MSAARDKLIRFCKGSEGEETVIRLTDLAEQSLRSRKYRLSGFLDPYGAEIAEAVAANFEEISVVFDGGYRGAERQRAALVHSDFAGTPSFDIAAVRVSWQEDFSRLTHRDILGALTGLGLDRSSLGDILIRKGTATVIADARIKDFIVENFTEAGDAKVLADICGLDEIAPREERTKDISATVASLRVDSVAAAGFGISRSRAAADIEAEKLKLNWQGVKNAAHPVKEGDVLSLRGRGRVEVLEIRGKTKKGRIAVSLKRFL